MIRNCTLEVSKKRTYVRTYVQTYKCTNVQYLFLNLRTSLYVHGPKKTYVRTYVRITYVRTFDFTPKIFEKIWYDIFEIFC